MLPYSENGRKQLKILNSNSGFSAMEVVVAIAVVAILGLIGIPEFKKYKAKSRQTEARLSLAALYFAEQNFRAQWSVYSVDLFNVGFSVQGKDLRFVTGFQSDTPCQNYSKARAGAPDEITMVTNTWSDGVTANKMRGLWAVGMQTKPAATGLTSCSDVTYTAAAYGTLLGADSGPINGDTWTLDQDKNIKHLADAKK